jgi:solute carrier family 25 protein 39/40
MAKITEFDVEDPRYRITPSQQMLCSCLGALTTSTLGNNKIHSITTLFRVIVTFSPFIQILVTPLDVVKIRLQAQQKPMLPNRCFIYCNGLMDHCIICVNGQGKQLNASIAKEQWYRRPGQFTGTLV